MFSTCRSRPRPSALQDLSLSLFLSLQTISLRVMRRSHPRGRNWVFRSRLRWLLQPASSFFSVETLSLFLPFFPVFSSFLPYFVSSFCARVPCSFLLLSSLLVLSILASPTLSLSIGLFSPLFLFLPSNEAKNNEQETFSCLQCWAAIVCALLRRGTRTVRMTRIFV